MQTLPNLNLSASNTFEDVKYRMDEYLQRIVQAANHNAKEIEVSWTMETPANGTYPIWIPHVPRKIIAVGVVLQAGTCTATVTQGGSTISWLTTGGTGLAVTTTELVDSATTGNLFVAGTKATVALSAVAGGAGFAITLRTGELRA